MVAAPLVVATGLLVFWGARTAASLKAQVEAWADSLEHSPNPVTMRLSFLPVYIGGGKVGKLDRVVIERHEAGTVDSVRIAITASDNADLDRLTDCQLHLDPDAFDRSGPLGYKHALSCVTDTSELVRFGSVALTGLGEDLVLYLDSADVPCQHMASEAAPGCTEFRQEIRRLKQEIRDEIRVDIRRSVRGH
ncbi:MAG: hypothetical protein OEO17_15725 [Gemmatimonadota bacterium]|nr:hypothetical protein [Gemmatimonadota bacterium]MDH3570350.1 hypothetical protein [Gemmatimonadota bacterium]MDH5551018.1 hypothetical protein [Gemmatimonadota bacterium]